MQAVPSSRKMAFYRNEKRNGSGHRLVEFMCITFNSSKPFDEPPTHSHFIHCNNRTRIKLSHLNRSCDFAHSGNGFCVFSLLRI